MNPGHDPRTPESVPVASRDQGYGATEKTWEAPRPSVGQFGIPLSFPRGPVSGDAHPRPPFIPLSPYMSAHQNPPWNSAEAQNSSVPYGFTPPASSDSYSIRHSISDQAALEESSRFDEIPLLHEPYQPWPRGGTVYTPNVSYPGMTYQQKQNNSPNPGAGLTSQASMFEQIPSCQSGINLSVSPSFSGRGPLDTNAGSYPRSYVASTGPSMPNPHRKRSPSSRSRKKSATCDICGKTFYGRDSGRNLQRHFDTDHSGKPKPVCPPCGKTFRRSDAMVKHARKQHPELPINPAVPRPNGKKDVVRNVNGAVETRSPVSGIAPPSQPGSYVNNDAGPLEPNGYQNPSSTRNVSTFQRVMGWMPQMPGQQVRPPNHGSNANIVGTMAPAYPPNPGAMNQDPYNPGYFDNRSQNNQDPYGQ